MSTWNDRLAKALFNRPQDWTYTGVAIEHAQRNGQCACGHCGLRFTFQLQDKVTKTTLWVGSQCIENFYSVMPATCAKVWKKAAELKKLATLKSRAEKELKRWQDYDAQEDWQIRNKRSSIEHFTRVLAQWNERAGITTV